MNRDSAESECRERLALRPDNMRVHLADDCDEYPNAVLLRSPSLGSYDVDVPKEQVRRWRLAATAFAQAQCEMREVMDREQKRREAAESDDTVVPW